MISKTDALLQDPIIIDEESGVLPETLHNDEHSSTADTSDYQALVSLSTFVKSPVMAYNYGDQPTRPNQAADFASFTTPTYTAQYMTAHAQPQQALPDSAEVPMLAGVDQYAAHDVSYPQQSQDYQAFATPANRTTPVVTQFEPAQGPAKGKLNVYLNAPADLGNSIQFPTVLFGSRRCSGLLTRLEPGHQGTHAITVDIPDYAATGSQGTNVTLSIDNNDLSGASMPVMFGNFKYTDATPYPMTSPPSATSRKRKLSVDAREQQPDKRTPHLRTDQFDALSSSPVSSAAISSYSPQPQAANYAYSQAVVARSQQYTSMPGSAPHATPRYASPQMGTPQLHIQPPSSDFVPNPGYIQERPGISTSLAGHSPATTTMSPAPTLVRTSTLQHDGGSPHSLSAPFSPYNMYPSTNKAVLKLDGDLNAMAENWTPEEISTSRRLIRFRRDQRANQLIASFEPVTLEDHSRAPGNIYVNCIWWKEKQACYITSVDTIQLLESLVGVRFTVEEKNRIRRNLEGFRPATVSKTKQDCEDFFKLIMGFPSPKPRNIEKDVKVFPWRILPHALKKIIGKYSASYSTAAGGMQSTIGSSSNASISPMNMHRHTATPPSAATTSSGGLHYPAHTMMPTSMPSHVTMGASAGAVPSSTMAPGMSWHQPSSSYASDLSSSGGRGSWDFGHTQNFMDPVPGAHLSSGRIPSISQWSGFDFTRSTQA